MLRARGYTGDCSSSSFGCMQLSLSLSLSIYPIMSRPPPSIQHLTPEHGSLTHSRYLSLCSLPTKVLSIQSWRRWLMGVESSPMQQPCALFLRLFRGRHPHWKTSPKKQGSLWLFHGTAFCSYEPPMPTLFPCYGVGGPGCIRISALNLLRANR